MAVVTVSILFVLILRYDTVTILANIEVIDIISIYRPSLLLINNTYFGNLNCIPGTFGTGSPMIDHWLPVPNGRFKHNRLIQNYNIILISYSYYRLMFSLEKSAISK